MQWKTLLLTALLTLVAGLNAGTAIAGPVDLASVPLISGLSKVVPPNVHFILDDSSSMAKDFMPDDVEDYDTRRCFKNWGYNKIYYNPNITYLAPVPYGTVTYANQDFTGAADDGFGVTSTDTDNLAEGDTQNLGNNPFTMTNNSRTVRVTDTGHGQIVGASVRFSGVPGPNNGTVNGVTGLNSTFTIASVIDANTYTVTAGNNATLTRTLTSDPFTMTNGSRTVTVRDDGHGRVVGDTVTFSGVPGANGGTVRGVRNLNGTFTITSVLDANRYRINAGNNATSSGSGGLGSVVVSYSPNGGGSVVKAHYANYFYYDYTSRPSSPPSTCAADNAYTKKWPLTAAEKQNFANWYSYYRTRMNMMKSASGRAFATVDPYIRVGFDEISNNSVNSVKVKIAGFDKIDDVSLRVQKDLWYEALYQADPFGANRSQKYTPLRGALSKAGRMYAGNVITGDDDPVQYSCQQNFSILTTDGYWNLTHERSSSPKYGPYRQDNNTLVGNSDNGLGTPFQDTYSNTLADIAMYYYKTDLRPNGALGGMPDGGTERLDVGTNNNVPPAGGDDAPHQHMTLFGLGLGVAGTLAYNENYLVPGSSVAYDAIVQGTRGWPNPDVLNNSSTVTERIDDLWHAAVNGRGKYLSASNPDSVVKAIRDTLAQISQNNGSGAAAATSSLEPVTGDEYAYVAEFTTAIWNGDLKARNISVTTGALDSTVSWSALAQLASKVGASTDSRTIHTFDSVGGGDRLKDFTPANLVNEKTAGHFRSNGLSQYGSWNAANIAAATDDAMIAYLRGQNGLEDDTDDGFDNGTLPFRSRSGALGDIVNAAPVFVKKPPFAYGDAGYNTFANDNEDRDPMVYVGANDGMLHAFDAETGAERWAFIPSAVIPRLYKLADAQYANNHEAYVDGPITVGDVYDTTDTEWKTVLVGGLGRGGKAYFALDVTDPDSPKALWEFDTSDDSDMGYSYGNPIVTKRISDGRWVVIFASGYNNGGDSKGRIYVVDAISGAKLQEIITDNTNDPDRSGVAKINNFVLNTLVDNSTQYVYGGDLAGNLWRFDLTGDGSQRLGRTAATAGDQPITVRPEIGLVRVTGGSYRVIYFGTGRYLGFTDLAATSPSAAVPQGIFAVKDTGTDLGVLTDPSADLVAQTLDADVTPRRIPNPVAVDWANDNGWYVQTPLDERITVDPRLQLGTLVVVANQPKDDYCSVGGTSWLYTFDYKTGAAVVTANNREVGQLIGSSIATGLTLIRLPTNKLIAIVTQADTNVQAMSVPVAPGAALGVRRVGWREIF